MSAPTHELVGLTGFAGSGKNAAADVLVAAHRFTQDSFALTLKKFAYDVDPFVQVDDGSFVRYAQLVDAVGVDIAKKNADVRRLLQRIGTDGGRRNIHQNVWVDATMARIASAAGPVVITDVRFPNEVDALRRAGGLLIRIDRPGYGPVNGHSSDTGITALDVDQVIVNDGTITQLQCRLTDLLGLTGVSADRVDRNPNHQFDPVHD